MEALHFCFSLCRASAGGLWGGDAGKPPAHSCSGAHVHSIRQVGTCVGDPNKMGKPGTPAQLPFLNLIPWYDGVMVMHRVIIPTGLFPMENPPSIASSECTDASHCKKWSLQSSPLLCLSQQRFKGLYCRAPHNDASKVSAAVPLTTTLQRSLLQCPS